MKTIKNSFAKQNQFLKISKICLWVEATQISTEFKFLYGG